MACQLCSEQMNGQWEETFWSEISRLADAPVSPLRASKEQEDRKCRDQSAVQICGSGLTSTAERIRPRALSDGLSVELSRAPVRRRVMKVAEGDSPPQASTRGRESEGPWYSG
jgi:hypothetical protein